MDQELEPQRSNHIKSAPALRADDLGWLRLSFWNSTSAVTMASSDGLDEDCVLQRGRSHSDPSSITEIRLGEAHRAGKRGETHVVASPLPRWSGRRKATVVVLIAVIPH